ncbi:T6SS immunity protein Tdi1 domain-containing protein [Ruania alba]|uniref:T6SS immunity protein Tdi1 C-terminal domain-containing protein n=1 Tax=Ruania alba TaxID=648782 RepID=A0A1H5KWU3_9MICO|nr:T6SS immunity protein Tdi1 domain-containing protein [Ruania alba]SEE69319.1 hypothetical protein SAMN04488554_2494 [Ruania alba]
MVTFDRFTPHAPIAAETIEQFAEHAPAGAVEMWRDYGAGAVGSDQFVRVIDPARGRQMLDGSIPLPETVVPMFTTGLADVVVWAQSMFLLYTFRWGTLQFTRDLTLDELTERMQDPTILDEDFRRQPYPLAATRQGIPAHEECFGFVPLLALGGPNKVTHLQKMGLYEHIAVITQLAGAPRPTGYLFEDE